MRGIRAAVRADAVVALALLIFAVALWLGADALPRSTLGGSVGASGLPKLLAVLLGVLSCALLAQALMARRPVEPETGGGMAWRSHLRAAGIPAIGVVVVLLLPLAGYAVTAALLLLSVALYHGQPWSLRLVLFAVVGGAVFHLLFVELLSVRMPPGVWARLLGS